MRAACVPGPTQLLRGRLSLPLPMASESVAISWLSLSAISPGRPVRDRPESPQRPAGWTAPGQEAPSPGHCSPALGEAL